MPYIKQEERVDIGLEDIYKLSEKIRRWNEPGRAGRLNYTISKLINHIYSLRNNPSYANINEAIGVLECIKQELYRRLAGPYEDKKIEENGDVF